MFNINDVVFDEVGDLGQGVILGIYTNYHDDSRGVMMYIVDFGDDQIFDRIESEIAIA